jgi:membrane protein implicated in regulation of membrane protease activity
MLEQVTGALLATALVLVYLIIVQLLMSAIVLLAQYFVLQVRALRRLLASAPQVGEAQPQGQTAPVVDGQSQPYRVGGGIRRWQ